MDNQPIQSSPPTPSSSNPSKTFLLILGAIVLMAVSGIGGYYLGANKQPSSSQPPTRPSQSLPTLTTTPTPTPDETANWKTYKNNEFSFSFQYPPNLKLTESKQLSRSNYKDMVTSIGLAISSSSGFSLTLEPNPKSLTVDQWLLERIEEEKASCEIDCPGFSSPTQKLTIAKRNAIIQNLGSVVPSVNIYLPVGKNTVLWASAVNIRNQFPTEENKNSLISILNTLQDNINK